MRSGSPARLLALAVLLPLAVGGCAALVVRGALPAGSTIEALGRSDEGTPFALDAAGRRLAVVRDQLTLVDLASGATRTLDGSPLALAFSPDGARLAASFQAGDGSVLRLYGLDGAKQAEARAPGLLTSLAWRSDAELVGASSRVEVLSYGTTREELLVRWDGAGAPRVEPLATTTMKRSTWNALGAQLARGPALAVAPLGDELAVTRFHDPPMFAPFFTVHARHLEAGAERELGRMPVGTAGPLWSPDGEAAWFGTGALVLQRPVWSPRARTTLSSPGRTLAVSPRGTWTFVDGRLLRGEEEVLAFSKDAEAAFTASGLVLRQGPRLVRLAAFAEPPPAAPADADLARRLELRKLRAMGLITPADFDAQLQRPPP